MQKATTTDDLYDRWSEHALAIYNKFDSNKKLFPLDIHSKQDAFTSRQIRRFMKGLHKGIYPRGKAWQRVKE